MKERCCLWCGRVFAPVNGVQRFCCKEHAYYAKIVRERKERRKKTVLSNNAKIELIAMKADELGMSYGEYVAKFGE